MPKKISEQELEAIAVIVADHPAGVQVGIIRESLEFDLPPRMLQRRLNLLAEQDRIVARGTGKGTRYFPEQNRMAPNFPGKVRRLEKTSVARYPFAHP